MGPTPSAPQAPPAPASPAAPASAPVPPTGAAAQPPPTPTTPDLPSPAVGRRRFRIAFGTWASLLLLFAVLLQPGTPQLVREAAGAAGLVLAGVLATASGVWRSRRERGSRARAWALLATAGVIVVAGNAWAALAGSGGLSTPSITSDVSVALGYLVSIPALLTFPGVRRRGTELMIVLDGLVAGGALLLVTTTLVYPRLLEAPARESAASQVLAFLFPGLDVVVATVAVLLVIRAAPADRLMLSLVATGFLIYAASDLAYAAQVADGTFVFGTLLNLGWIGGYLTLALAAWVPQGRHRVGDAPTRVGAAPAPLSDVPGTTLLFGVVVVAAVVQVVSEDDGALAGAQSAVWVALITAAAARQVLLIRANQNLRRDLERRVELQTADLRSLVRQNETLVTSVGDGVYGVDQDGRVTFVNPSGAAALGYPVSELVGVRAHEVFHAPGSDGVPHPWSGCYIHEAIVGGVLARGEEDDYVRADGSLIPVEITASPLLDGDDVQGAVVVFRDVTQRREVDRMKDEFLSVVSHELRTPLTSIRGSLGLLSAGHLGELPDAAGPMVTVAQQSTERLARLVDDLLDLERVGSGVEPLELDRLDVGAVLRSVARQMEGLAVAAEVDLRVDETSSGPICADEDKLLQLLVNLVANAVKFSPVGGTVHLLARPEGTWMHVEVRDEGRGIPPDKLESVFARFEQVDSSDSRQKGGAGLGLTISRAIVEQHGGRIWITSEMGRGTEVHVLLRSPEDPSSA